VGRCLIELARWLCCNRSRSARKNEAALSSSRAKAGAQAVNMKTRAAASRGKMRQGAEAPRGEANGSGPDTRISMVEIIAQKPKMSGAVPVGPHFMLNSIRSGFFDFERLSVGTSAPFPVKRVNGPPPRRARGCAGRLPPQSCQPARKPRGRRPGHCYSCGSP